MSGDAGAPAGEISGRVSDGQFVDGVAVHLIDPATGALLHTVATAPCDKGAAGFFRFGPELLGIAGRRISLGTAIGTQDDSVAAVIPVTVPPAGRSLDLRFVLPPISNAPALAVADRDAEACGACALPRLFQVVAAPQPDHHQGSTGVGASPHRRRMLRALPAGPAIDPVEANRLPPDSEWRSFRSGGIQVDYAVAGPHALSPEQLAPPAAPRPVEGGALVVNDVPEHVQLAAIAASRAEETFCGLWGLRAAAAGGLLRVRLCAFDTPGVYGETRAAWDHVRINLRNGAEQNDGTIAHEVFHRVQYRYNASDHPDAELHRAIREGGATLAEECVTPDANRYVLRAMTYFARPWIPIAAPRTNGASQPYAAALLWRYLEEQRPGRAAAERRNAQGPGLAVMDMILNATATIDATDDGGGPAEQGYRFAALRRRLIGTVRFHAWQRLADPDATPACTDTLYGNWLLVNALTRRAADVADPRFRYAEWNVPTARFVSQGGQPIPPTRLVDLRRPVMEGDAVGLVPGRTVILPQDAELPMWSARYFLLRGEGLACLRLSSPPNDDPPIVQLARMTAGGRLFIDRAEGNACSFRIRLDAEDDLMVVVASRTQAFRFLLEAWLGEHQPLPFITPWNAAPGTRHETDPDERPWDWTSPDIALADPATGALARAPQAIRVRVRNHGNASLSGARVRLSGAALPDRSAPFAFRPLLAPDGTPAEAAVPEVAPDGDAIVTIAWLPDAASDAAHWLVRASVLDQAGNAATAIGRLAPLPDPSLAHAGGH
jgi:hypothetical protein